MFGKKNIKILAPFDCEVKRLEDVPDEIFADKVVGDGLAVIPTAENAVVMAPCNGILSVMFRTGHAFGINADDGVELLVHIGVDTVELNGQGFEIIKKQGDDVKQGESVLKADFKKIAELGKPIITPVVVTNPSGYNIKFLHEAGVKLKVGEILLELTK